MKNLTTMLRLSGLLCCVGVVLWAVPVQARSVSLTVTDIQVKRKSGSVNEGAVRATVSRNIQPLRKCLKGALEDHDKYEGLLWLSFHFTNRGAIRNAAATSTLSNKFMTKCIIMHMNRWRMGKGGRGSVTATVNIKR